MIIRARTLCVLWWTCHVFFFSKDVTIVTNKAFSPTYHVVHSGIVKKRASNSSAGLKYPRWFTTGDTWRYKKKNQRQGSDDESLKGSTWIKAGKSGENCAQKKEIKRNEKKHNLKTFTEILTLKVTCWSYFLTGYWTLKENEIQYLLRYNTVNQACFYAETSKRSHYPFSQFSINVISWILHNKYRFK